MRIGFVSGTVIPEERGFVTLPLSMLVFHVILDTILGINLDHNSDISDIVSRIVFRIWRSAHERAESDG